MIREERQISEVDKIAIKTINLLEIKKNEVGKMLKSHLSYHDEKKLDRILVAIKHSLENIRRAKLENGVPKIIS